MPKQDVLKFVFQEIDLAEIPKLLPNSYRSRYHELMEQIMQRLTTMDSDKSFIFRPEGNGKLTDALIKSMSQGLNTRFNREKLDWRVTYSPLAKAFVVRPRDKTKKNRYTAKLKPLEPQNLDDNPNGKLHFLAAVTLKTFHVTREEMTSKDMRTRLRTSDFKRAMLYVGREHMGLPLSVVGRWLGIGSASSTHAYQKALTHSKPSVDLLLAAITKNGGQTK